MDLKILKSDEFFQAIEGLVKSHNLSYIDAVAHFCESNNVEIETAAALIKGNQRLKSEIQIEGENLRVLPRTSRLPI